MEVSCTHQCCCRHNIASFIGRILIGAFFIVAALYKIDRWDAVVQQVANVGLALPGVFLGVGILLEFVGGISILLGYKTRLGAFLLILLLVVSTFLFSSFWAASAEDAAVQLADFFKNLYFIGALLLLTAFGPGRYSLDACCACKTCH